MGISFHLLGMSWETSYKHSGSKQDSKPPRSPTCHCFAWRGDSAIAHRLLALTYRVEANFSHGILGVVSLLPTVWNQALGNTVEYWKKRDQHPGICLGEANSSPAMELVFACPVWDCQEPLCLADARVFSTKPSPGESEVYLHKQIVCTGHRTCLESWRLYTGRHSKQNGQRAWMCGSHISQIYICLECF